jgi:uncharacterized damage-inducible protein DinB
MNSRDAIKLGIDMANRVSMDYLKDLTDEELMKRPHPGCNHIKWQLGHLISGEHQMTETISPGSMPALPTGFAERYTPETAKLDDPKAFDSKAELLRVFEQQRAAALKVLERQSDADLAQPSPESMRSYAPTVGHVFTLHGSHWLMHAGQWAVIRRQLGRPPLY